MKLTPTQRTWLQWLHNNGGSGWLDAYGRVIANGANSKQGAQISWLNLFVKGAVRAESDRIVLSEAGYHALGFEREPPTVQCTVQCRHCGGEVPCGC